MRDEGGSENVSSQIHTEQSRGKQNQSCSVLDCESSAVKVKAPNVS